MTKEEMIAAVQQAREQAAKQTPEENIKCAIEHMVALMREQRGDIAKLEGLFEKLAEGPIELETVMEAANLANHINDGHELMMQTVSMAGIAVTMEHARRRKAAEEAANKDGEGLH